MVPDAAESLAGASLYETYAGRGLELGQQFRWIEQLWNQDGRVHATFRAPRPGDECDRYVLHPGLLDSYFQMASGFLAADHGDAVLWLPVRIGRIEMGHPVRRAVHGYAERVAASSDDGVLTAHLRLFDETGAPAGRIDGLQLRRVSREALRRMSGEDRREWLYRLEWRPAPLPSESPAAEPAHWLIFGAGGATPDALEARLRALGHTCSQYSDDVRPIGQFLARQSDEHPRGPLHLLYLASLDDETGTPDANPLDRETTAAAAVLALLQAGAGIATHRRLALWIVTRQTQAVRPEDVVLPAASGIVGAGQDDRHRAAGVVGRPHRPRSRIAAGGSGGPPAGNRWPGPPRAGRLERRRTRRAQPRPLPRSPCRDVRATAGPNVLDHRRPSRVGLARRGAPRREWRAQPAC